MGYRRARHKARAEMRNIAAHWEAKVLALQHDYHELALEHHRQCYDRALDEAIEQRAMDADIVLGAAHVEHSVTGTDTIASGWRSQNAETDYPDV